MTLRKKFNETEWETLQYAPLWVHTTVGLVDGKIDTNETDALADEIRKAIFWKNDLAREVLTSIAEDFDTVITNYINDPRGVKEGLSQVNEILSQKISTDISLGFKKALFVLATHTAKASGGWEGAKWTGSSTSPEEKKAIQFICDTLNVTEDEMSKNF